MKRKVLCLAIYIYDHGHDEASHIISKFFLKHSVTSVTDVLIFLLIYETGEIV